MNIKMAIYAGLTILGAVWTGYYNLQFMEAGFEAVDFFTLGFVNPVSSSLTADLTVSCLAFLAWLPFEARRLGMKYWGLYVLFTFTVAFAFSFPLFLLMRERKLRSDGMSTA